jgi:hypothetical protein
VYTISHTPDPTATEPVGQVVAANADEPIAGSRNALVRITAPTVATRLREKTLFAGLEETKLLPLRGERIIENPLNNH